MNLTERRLEQFRPMFEGALASLKATGRYDVHDFEQKLKDGMSCGYQELKPFINDLAKYGTYLPVAIYYMEHAGSSIGVVTEFQNAVSHAYGIAHYHTDDREAAKKRFWDRVLTPTDKSVDIEK